MKQNYTISIDKEIMQTAKQIAIAEDRSLSDQIKRFIKQGISQYNKNNIAQETIQEITTAKNANAKENNLLTLAQLKSYFKIEQKFSEMKEILKENKVPFEEVAGGEREYNVTGFDIEKLFKG